MYVKSFEQHIGLYHQEKIDFLFVILLKQSGGIGPGLTMTLSLDLSRGGTRIEQTQSLIRHIL